MSGTHFKIASIILYPGLSVRNYCDWSRSGARQFKLSSIEGSLD